MTHTTKAFFDALARRRINFKEAAYIGGRSAKSLQRLAGGETNTLDAELVGNIARKLPDGPAFLADVFGAAARDPLAGIRADLETIKGALASSPSAFWFDENGRRFPAVPDLEVAARLALNLPPEVAAAAYVRRNLGWVSVDAGTLNAMPGASPAALTAARTFLDGGDMPAEWGADCAPLETTARADLRRLVSAAGIGDIRDALQKSDLLDRTALYRVEPGSVVTVWLGARIKTDPDELGRPLQARCDRRFATMLDRHVRSTIARGPGVWRLKNIATAGVRASYERVALPSADRNFVAHVVDFQHLEAAA